MYNTTVNWKVSVCDESRTHSSEGVVEGAPLRLPYCNTMQDTNSYNIEIFKKRSGRRPFDRSLESIGDKTTCARIWKSIEKMGIGNFGVSERLTSDVYELKLTFGPGYRIYYSKLGSSNILILHLGDKSSQPLDVITAEQYVQEYKRSMT